MHLDLFWFSLNWTTFKKKIFSRQKKLNLPAVVDAAVVDKRRFLYFTYLEGGKKKFFGFVLKKNVLSYESAYVDIVRIAY